MKHETILASDPAYQEWSETIEQQAREQQDFEMTVGEHYAMEWDEVRTIEREVRSEPGPLLDAADYRGADYGENIADPNDFQVVDLSKLSWDKVLEKMKTDFPFLK